AAGGDERGQLLTDDALAERRLVPGERHLEAPGLEVALELALDPRVEDVRGEALRHDPVDRESVLAALIAMGAEELRANAGGQAFELDPEPRALQEVVERAGLGAMIGLAGDPVATVALRHGRRRNGTRREHRPDQHRDRRATSHLSSPWERAVRSP